MVTAGELIVTETGVGIGFSTKMETIDSMTELGIGEAVATRVITLSIALLKPDGIPGVDVIARVGEVVGDSIVGKGSEVRDVTDVAAFVGSEGLGDPAVSIVAVSVSAEDVINVVHVVVAVISTGLGVAVVPVIKVVVRAVVSAAVVGRKLVGTTVSAVSVEIDKKVVTNEEQASSVMLSVTVFVNVKGQSLDS